MDAASNNGVDDIREIREKINFLPTRAKYRIYIIDEVHMLSSGAFNAFLKTLEEPPEHVKFILATTEPQKLIATILSRCQRFDFKKISNEDLIKRMKIVCTESGIEITDIALNLIATLAEGGARDALSILERCTQDGDTKIDEDKVKDLVGIPKFVYIYNIIRGITDKDIEQSLKAMQDVLDEGKDLNNFLWEMIKLTKDILMYKVTKKNDIYSDEELKQINEISEKLSKDELINIIYKLSELENKMKWSSQKKVIFETEIIKLCMKNDTLGLEDRVEKLEKSLKTGDFKEIPQKEIVKEVRKEIEISKEEKQEKSRIKQEIVENKSEKKEEVKTKIIADGNIIDNWQNVLGNLKKQGKVILYANLVNTEAVEINDMTVGIKFYNGLNQFRENILNQPENISILTKEISMICGKTMNIKFEDASSAGKTETARNKKTQENPIEDKKEENEEDILNSLDIPINFVEE